MGSLLLSIIPFLITGFSHQRKPRKSPLIRIWKASCLKPLDDVSHMPSSKVSCCKKGFYRNNLLLMNKSCVPTLQVWWDLWRTRWAASLLTTAEEWSRGWPWRKRRWCGIAPLTCGTSLLLIFTKSPVFVKNERELLFFITWRFCMKSQLQQENLLSEQINLSSGRVNIGQ